MAVQALDLVWCISTAPRVWYCLLSQVRSRVWVVVGLVPSSGNYQVHRLACRDSSRVLRICKASSLDFQCLNVSIFKVVKNSSCNGRMVLSSFIRLLVCR